MFLGLAITPRFLLGSLIGLLGIGLMLLDLVAEVGYQQATDVLTGGEGAASPSAPWRR